MPEVRITKPWVSHVYWNLNKIKEGQTVYNQAGEPVGTRPVDVGAGLKIGITPYIGQVPLATEEYSFPAGDALDAVLVAAGDAEIADKWQSALSDMADEFPVLKDPTTEELDDGLPYVMRLDSWRAVFKPEGGSSVSAILGFYKPDETEIASGYQEITFADKTIRLQRKQQRDQIVENRDFAKKVLGDPEESEERKEQAKIQIEQSRAQLAAFDAQLIGTMESLLALPTVAPAVGALLSGVFVTLKATSDHWKDIDLAQLMTDVQAAFGRLIQ